ncbi:MAG TPA: hypothetical protein VKK79_05865, partial [Candidatus Lokiarchaeia archaeon]|nr:hypothetical protein [Candidatus Lokiarchaeia archaeon]
TITGTHHCRLNCGDCCDGTGRTTGSLGGGLYCPSLLGLGRYCLFYLADVPLEEKNQICQEYFCGDVSPQANTDNRARELCGTSLGAFVPEYSQAMREEFFQVLDAVFARGLRPQEAIERTAKWGEI